VNTWPENRPTRLAFGESREAIGGCHMPLGVLTVRVNEEIRIDCDHELRSA
jgi:hypothetical protein